MHLSLKDLTFSKKNYFVSTRGPSTTVLRDMDREFLYSSPLVPCKMSVGRTVRAKPHGEDYGMMGTDSTLSSHQCAEHVCSYPTTYQDSFTSQSQIDWDRNFISSFMNCFALKIYAATYKSVIPCHYLLSLMTIYCTLFIACPMFCLFFIFFKASNLPQP